MKPLSLCFFAACCWGLWWIPLAWLQSMGLDHGLAAVACNLGALPPLLLLALLKRQNPGLSGFLGAALIGGAIALFGASLTMTDIVRAIILFYLAPVWSLLIEVSFLNRRWTKSATLSLLMAALGILFVLRADISLDGLNKGDLIAFVSGFSWAVGSYFIFQSSKDSAGLISLVAALSAIMIGISLAAGQTTLPNPGEFFDLLGPSLLTGSLFLAPVIFLTIWGALHLPPATVSFLLTAEIVTGVGSSALLSGQRFGLPELTGTILILSAALLEVRSSASGTPKT